eukprot:7903953-Alexandrium_andersonii.AAC.1
MALANDTLLQLWEGEAEGGEGGDTLLLPPPEQLEPEQLATPAAEPLQPGRPQRPQPGESPDE